MVASLDTAINLIEMGQRAKEASFQLSKLSTEQKNTVLLAIADALEANAEEILEANRLDLADGRANGLSDALLDRLDLQNRLKGIAADVRNVATLPDPVGQILDERVLENGLKVSRRRTPIGVLGVIYEARPNVTVDVATLAFKTGNAVILRGGKETLRSNMALVNILRDTMIAHGVPQDVIQYINSTDRRYVGELLKLHDYVDMIIPRGGNSLHNFCREHSTIPVITGGIGICHLFVDASADQEAALKIIHNAKTQRPSVCNALDTLLVHESIAVEFLPRVVAHLGKDGVTFRAEKQAYDLVQQDEKVSLAQEGDFDTEWLSLILGLKVVSSLDEAIQHIRQHSTFHSDGILTQDMDNANRFLAEVDSAAVYVNASTRFTDGSALGLGAEVAISTQKLHARGPMGLEELTTYKWIIIGNGHVR
ncbi:MAG: glutamate-5-semialdehyde dehydrogenase [Phototrophicales bacterium]|nr:MAG: glutamate-5-semialdehyde dehydrogenase [Phototrophicales bacterium]RMG73716.1 MAG: glutamate-5-semialdehyde dehydrogenase [Chloroflexota bacterium]